MVYALPDKIRAISLHQPWAALKCTSAKNYETRSRPAPSTLDSGELIAIHAAKRPYRDQYTRQGWQSLDLVELMAIYNDATGDDVAYAELAHGAIVGLCEYEETLPVECVGPDEIEALCGDYSAGRWAWKMPVVYRFEYPIPAVGSQGIWWWDAAESASWKSAPTRREM